MWGGRNVGQATFGKYILPQKSAKPGTSGTSVEGKGRIMGSGHPSPSFTQWEQKTVLTGFISNKLAESTNCKLICLWDSFFDLCSLLHGPFHWHLAQPSTVYFEGWRRKVRDRITNKRNFRSRKYEWTWFIQADRRLCWSEIKIRFGNSRRRTGQETNCQKLS